MAFNIAPQTGLAQWADVTPGPTAWVRPSDWPVITDNANELNFLLADTGLAAFALVTTFTTSGGTGNIYVEWGDGTTTTISTTTSTTTYKNYTVGSGTACSLGYTTFKCRIYADPTVTGITKAQFIGNVRTTDSRTVYTVYSSGILEVYLGDTLTQFITYANYAFSNSSFIGSSIGNYQQLQYFKFPATVTASNFSQCFAECHSLRQVVMPTSAANMSNLSSMFYFCKTLNSVTFPTSAPAITNLSNIFQNCYSLTTVVFPPIMNSCTTMASAFTGCSFLTSVTMPTEMNACTSMSGTFSNCTNLTRMTLPTLNACLDYTLCFSGCRNLQAMVIKNWNTNINQSLNLSSMFQNCSALTTIQLPNTQASGTIANLQTMFTGCTSLLSLDCSALSNSLGWQTSPNCPVFGCTALISVVMPTTLANGFLQGTFSTCTALQSCVMPTSMPSLTSMVNTFGNCTQLKSITLPATVGATFSFGNAFQNCSALTSVTIPAGYNLTSVGNTFQGCSALQTVTFPPGAQNSLTSLASAFQNCFSLTTVNMPSSMTGLTSLANTFQNCTALTIPPTLPASLNAVTTVNLMFGGCQSLTSATNLPTSMSSCTTWTNMFDTCIALREVILPATVSAGAITFNSTFIKCFSLRTVTLPTTQMTGLTNSVQMFNQCASLTTVNNLNRIGDTATTANNYINADQMFSFAAGATGGTLTGKFSKLAWTSAVGYISGLSTLRLSNTATGQWGGSSPQIDISNSNMGQAALVALFNDLQTVVGKTINITNCTGAAALTAPERAIATGKGWTITG